MRKIRHFYVYLIIFLVLLILFLTNDFGVVDVQKVAIITGLAIDKKEDVLTVTADIAVPQSSKQEKKTQPLQVEGNGKTVSECLTQIGDKTGWFPKLVYCHIILLGEGTLGEDVFKLLDTFLRDEYISDNSLIACTDGEAKKIYSSTSPVDDITSLALQKIISSDYLGAGRCASTNLKEFSMGYFGESKSGFMPIIKLAPVSSEGSSSKSDGGGEESSQGGGSGKSGESGGEDKLFDDSSTALFYGGVKVGELDKDETFAFNLLRRKVRQGTIETESEGAAYSLRLKNNKGSIDFKVDDYTPKMKVSLSVRAALGSESQNLSVENLYSAPAVSDDVKKSLSEDLKKRYESIFKKSRETGCDVFELTKKLKRFENKHYEGYKNDILLRTQAEYEIKILSS